MMRAAGGIKPGFVHIRAFIIAYLSPLRSLRGEVAALFARRVRGYRPHLHCPNLPIEVAPHPNPLPAKCGARERTLRAR
jgi:hypothetical protein